METGACGGGDGADDGWRARVGENGTGGADVAGVRGEAFEVGEEGVPEGGVVWIRCNGGCGGGRGGGRGGRRSHCAGVARNGVCELCLWLRRECGASTLCTVCIVHSGVVVGVFVGDEHSPSSSEHSLCTVPRSPNAIRYTDACICHGAVVFYKQEAP